MAANAPDLEEMLRAIGTRQLPLVELLPTLRALGRTLRNEPGLVSEVQRLGGVESLLYYVEKVHVASAALSVLANCLVHERVRADVLRANGVQTLARILANIATESILNRACRAIANVSLSLRGAQAVHQTPGVINAIIDLLNTSKSKDSQATAMRALRILGCTSAFRESITSLGGLGSLGRALQAVAAPLRRPCVDTLEKLTRRCSSAAARQLVQSGALPLLVELSATLDGACFTVINLSHLDEMLVEVGSASFIPRLVTRLEESTFSPFSSGKDPKREVSFKWNSAFVTLCRLCKEPYNLIRVRDSKGLALFVTVLNDSAKKKLWTYATYTLLQYRHDDTALAELLRLGLIECLVKHLEDYSKDRARDHPVEQNKGSIDKEASPRSSKQDGQSDRSSCVSGHSNEQEAVLSHTDTDTVTSNGSDHECAAAVDNLEEAAPKRPKLFCVNSPSYLEIVQAKSLSFNYDSRPSEEYGRYAGLPGYTSMSPRSVRPPGSPDFEDPSAPSSPGSLPSCCVSPFRVEDDTSQDAAYSPVYESPNVSSSSGDEDSKQADVDPCVLLEGQKNYQSTSQKRLLQTTSSTTESGKITARRKSCDTKMESITSSDTIIDHALRIFEIYTFPRSIKMLVNVATMVCIALLRYIAAVPTSFSRAEKVVLVIGQHTDFFMRFLHEDRIPEVLRILDPVHTKTDCSRCFYLSMLEQQFFQKMASVAGGGLGSGEVARLLVGDAVGRRKEQAALAVPFVVHDKSVLHSLLFYCGALDLLFDVVEAELKPDNPQSPSVEEQLGSAAGVRSCRLASSVSDASDTDSASMAQTEKCQIESAQTNVLSTYGVGDLPKDKNRSERFQLAVRALREIGKTFHITFDGVSSTPDIICNESCSSDDLILKDDSSDEGVVLELEGGNRLILHREKLMTKVSYFAAMLHSDRFIEGKSNSISLPTVTKMIAQKVLHAVTCRNGCVKKLDSIEVALQCLELSHMLLLKSVEASLSETIASLMLRPSDAALVYPRVSLYDGSPLRQLCVAILISLNQKASSVDVAGAMAAILRTRFGGHFLEDLRRAIESASNKRKSS